MIAPVNCCSDCDCAQRSVRCQRAAPTFLERDAKPADDQPHRSFDTPPMVIPASLATNAFRAATETYKDEPNHFIDVLDELEKEFPADMGISPDLPPEVKLREFTPLENKAFDRTDKVCRLIKAFRNSDLDCGMWSDNALAELADLALITLEAA